LDEGLTSPSGKTKKKKKLRNVIQGLGPLLGCYSLVCENGKCENDIKSADFIALQCGLLGRIIRN